MVGGKIVAGPYVRAACERHLRDLDDGELRGLRWNPESAAHALGFFPAALRLNGGQFEGKPFALHPAQEFIVGSLFGWQRWDEKHGCWLRRFRFAYIEQGKGNGKSPLVAGIGIYGMLCDHEPRAEIYAAASKKDQAMILFRDAVAMVDQSPPIARRLKKSGRGDQVWNLYDEATNSHFRPISAESGQSGPRPHIGLVDELHEHRDGKVINMLAAGRKSRRQPMTIAITNSGTDRKSVCFEYRQKSIRVCQGMEVDDTLFSYVCALDEGEDPFKDEACWIKANPLLGTVISEQYLRDEVNQARGMPSKESMVRRLNFCEWTQAHNPFVAYEPWCDAAASYTLEKFRGMTAVGAFDLSATRDLTAFTLTFNVDELLWTWTLFWIPENDLVERAKRDNVPIDAWVRDGFVRTTPGDAIDKDFVVHDVAALLGQYDITLSQVPYDRHRIDVLKAAMDREGVDWPIEPFGQGFVSMAPAIDEFEGALIAGTLRHPDNPCMNWNAANAVVVQDPAGNRKLDKAKATGRIDGMVTMCMSICRAKTTQPERSVYETRGLRTL